MRGTLVNYFFLSFVNCFAEFRSIGLNTLILQLFIRTGTTF
jgi:hypothetical protein